MVVSQVASPHFRPDILFQGRYGCFSGSLSPLQAGYFVPGEIWLFL